MSWTLCCDLWHIKLSCGWDGALNWLLQVLSSHLPSRSSPDISAVLSLPPNLHNMKPTPAKGIFSYVRSGLCISARASLHPDKILMHHIVTPAPSKGNRRLFSSLHGTYSLIGGKHPCPFPFQTLSQSLLFCHDVHRGWTSAPFPAQPALVILPIPSNSFWACKPPPSGPTLHR